MFSMHRLHNTPIRRSLVLIGMLTSGFALLLTCGVLIVIEQFSARTNLQIAILETATMIGVNNAAALTSNASELATASLGSLSNDAGVTAAAIYDRRGEPFALYRNSTAAPVRAPPVEHNTRYFDVRGLSLFTDIRLDGKTIGVVYIQHDWSQTQLLQRNFALVAVLVMLVALVINWLISSRLYRVITGPISHLSTVVGVVAAEKNYSVRAVKRGNNELGELIDGFNAMLTQIQSQDSALQEAREHLEERIVERTAELATSVSLLNATLDSTADGIVAIDNSGEMLCHNAQYVAMWRMPSEALQPGAGPATARAIIATQVKDSQYDVKRIAEIMANPEMESFDLIELKDGRSFERYTKPQKIAGRTIGRVINFRDISTRRRAEEELRTINTQLLEASRQAGMAEVATNVLHNVGNVLNSVNVSSNLIAETLTGSKVGGLPKVVALLDAHKDELGTYITADARGRQLPAYLTQLSLQLIAERNLTLKEMESLRSNIGHIKTIVSMQQSYSKVSGMTESIDLLDLVEDAVQMASEAMQSQDVEIIREFGEVPNISSQKHKILQILVNLVRNAKYACSKSGREGRRITLRVVNGENAVDISVIDNGVGITAENLTRVFCHGFTTRADGHGYGLHSGALAARELGGSLRVYSGGAGLGATFTLELPLAVA